MTIRTIQTALSKIRDLADQALQAGNPSDNVFLYKKAMAEIVFKAVETRRAELEELLVEAVGNRVQKGPFSGMEIPRKKNWDFCVKTLGFYEEELHPHLTHVIESGFPLVVNIGSAEGYYAVGLARQMVNSRIIAFELERQSRDGLALAAQLNGVAERVEIRGLCTLENLGALLREEEAAHHPAPFLLLDCEGAELELLDPVALPELGRCDFIVECHDLLNHAITPTLMARFQESHHLLRIQQGGRNPSAIPLLKNISDLDRWLLVDEGRPGVMHWLIATVRQDEP